MAGAERLALAHVEDAEIVGLPRDVAREIGPRDDRHRAGMVLHRHLAVRLGELARRGEVVGMGLGVDHVADVQPVARGQRAVAVDLADLGIDQRRAQRVGATDQIGLAPAGGYLLEDHRRSPFRYDAPRARLPPSRISPGMRFSAGRRPATHAPATVSGRLSTASAMGYQWLPICHITTTPAVATSVPIAPRITACVVGRAGARRAVTHPPLTPNSAR